MGHRARGRRRDAAASPDEPAPRRRPSQALCGAPWIALNAADIRLLVQPDDRGTATGVLFPAHWVSWRDPDAILAVFPSDHFILDDAALMAHVAELAAFVRRRPRWIVVVGARPPDAETGCSWVEPGETLDATTSGRVSTVRGFWERPSAEAAGAGLDAGRLCNTRVVVAKASALIEAGRRSLPVVHERLASIAAFAGTAEEAWAVRQAFARAPTADFARSILMNGLPNLAVSRMPDESWSGWGTPDRVLERLQ